MGYIENNLMQDETVAYTGRVHPFSLVPGLLVFVLGAAIGSYPVTNPDAVPPFAKMFMGLGGGMIALVGFCYLVSSLVRKLTTELALTTRRIIGKSGLIVRELVELSYAKIESVSVDQSILGMLLGYGTFYIHGVGGSKAGIRCIAAPMEFRKHALEMLDKASRAPDGKA
jgi:uncharacterized membrane protein YdbT with pleckstrin-like domain